jgi:hypothetical protein
MKKEDCKVGEHYMLVINGERKGEVRYQGPTQIGSAQLMTKAGSTRFEPHECLRRIKPKREKRRWFFNVWNSYGTSVGYSSIALAVSGIDTTDPDYLGTVEVREVRWVKRAGEGGKP